MKEKERRGVRKRKREKIEMRRKERKEGIKKKVEWKR